MPPPDDRPRALPELSERLYAELRDLAGGVLARNPDSPLEATALLHEAYVKVAASPGSRKPSSRTHFLAVSARAMRHILVDHARGRRRLKRGGDRQQVTLISQILGAAEPLDVLALHDCLERLRELDERATQVVELRFFGGLTTEEIAEQLGISERTVRLDWSMARAWLGREFGAEDAGE